MRTKLTWGLTTGTHTRPTTWPGHMLYSTQEPIVEKVESWAQQALTFNGLLCEGVSIIYDTTDSFIHFGRKKQSFNKSCKEISKPILEKAMNFLLSPTKKPKTKYMTKWETQSFFFLFNGWYILAVSFWTAKLIHPCAVLSMYLNMANPTSKYLKCQKNFVWHFHICNWNVF